MKIKRFCCIFLTVMALAVLPAGAACAESWWNTTSADAPAYPLSPPPAKGDLNGNGTVDAADARQTLRFAVGLDTDLLQYSADPDYNGDGRVSAEDARLVLRRAAGLEGSPTPKADDGAYRIRVCSLSGEYDDLGALIPLETNPNRVTGCETAHFPLWQLRSVADVEAFCAAFCEAGIKPYDSMEIPTFLRRYDEAFFADRALFICYTVESSGSNLQTVYPPVITGGETIAAYEPLPETLVRPAPAGGGTLTFSVGSASPEVSTCDMADWFLFLPMEKEAAAGCAAFDCLRGISGVLSDKEYRAVKNQMNCNRRSYP